MGNDVLAHYGVVGMKWGVRRSPAQLGHDTRRKKFRKRDPTQGKSDSKTASKTSSSKKSVRELSDDELRQRIQRLELERKYSDLSSAASQKKISKGRRFVYDVLEKSGKNIATQLSAYAMGQAVNAMLGKNAVDPKNIQKKK